MSQSARHEIALEIGPKRRVFAQAIAWPGWCRAGKTEETALAQLLAVSARYAGVAQRAGVSFLPPASVADLVVVERVPGTHVTDFGAPATLLASDADPVDDADVERLARLLMACWKTFDERFGTISVQEREAAPTRGRSPGAMRWHLVETDRLHAAAFGAVVRPGDPTRVEEQEAEVRQHLLGAWQAVPRRTRFTPSHRYGFAWTPHFAVRRSAWHALDHAWQLDELAALA